MCFSKNLIIAVFCICCTSVFAQQETEYRMEIGVIGGVGSYLGDANTTFYKEIAPAFGGLFRYRFDTRFSARAEYTRTNVKGETALVEFDNPVNVLDLCGEFNFFDLEKSKYKRFSKRYSPYVFVGIGGMNYKYNDKQSFGISVPFGVGLKVKLIDRLNFNLQFSNRLLLKDNLEGVEILNDPYGLNGSNFLNNDFLSTITVGLTFDIWKKKCDCITF